MLGRLLIILTCVAGAGGANASFLAQNGLLVKGSADRIEVFSSVGSSGAEFFCAAGDFARHKLKARAVQRIEISRALAPSITVPGRRSVVFRYTNASNGPIRSFRDLFLSPRRTGQIRSVAAAAAQCEELR